MANKVPLFVSSVVMMIHSGDDPQKIVSRHHELLHKYNETKDATQVNYDLPVLSM